MNKIIDSENIVPLVWTAGLFVILLGMMVGMGLSEYYKYRLAADKCSAHVEQESTK